MENRYGENDYLTAYTKEGLLFCEFKPCISITSEVSFEIMELLLSMCGSLPFYVLVDMKNIQWIDKSSRDYIASHPLTAQNPAWAFYSPHSLHRILYEVYNTFSKPKTQTAFFITQDEAIGWTRYISGQR